MILLLHHIYNFFNYFLDSLPNILAAKDLKELINIIIDCHKNNNIVAIGMGAHVIKVGLSPLIIKLIEKQVLSSIAMNGTGIIHDLEIALVGHTSEDIASSLKDGSFGMCKETAFHLNNVIKDVKVTSGLGYAVGKYIQNNNFKYKDYSILAKSIEYDIPLTVHIAMETDILHIHPDFNAASFGRLSHTDFKIFSNII